MKEVNIMANLIKRENRDVTRSASPEHRLDPFRMMDALLRWDPFRGDWGGFAQNLEFVPRFDVKETRDAYVISADLPGVKDEELEVSLSGNLLTISGRREEEHKEEGESYYAMERSHGSFGRSFTMPQGVDADSVTADLKHGVLSVRVAKKPEAQPKRIAIGTGGETKAKA
jgi:HSP20 family protein